MASQPPTEKKLLNRILSQEEYDGISGLVRTNIPGTKAGFRQFLDDLPANQRCCSNCDQPSSCKRHETKYICVSCAASRQQCSLVDEYKHYILRQHWKLADDEIDEAYRLFKVPRSGKGEPKEKGKRASKGGQEAVVTLNRKRRRSNSVEGSPRPSSVTTAKPLNAPLHIRRRLDTPVGTSSSPPPESRHDATTADKPRPSTPPAGPSPVVPPPLVSSSNAENPLDVSSSTKAEITRLARLLKEAECSRDRYLLAYQETLTQYRATQDSLRDFNTKEAFESSARLLSKEPFERDLREVPIDTLASFILKDLGCWVAARSLLQTHGEQNRQPGMPLINLESVQTATRLADERIDFLHHWIIKMLPMLSGVLHNRVLEGTPPQDIDNLDKFIKAATEERERLVELQRADQIRERLRREQEEAERAAREAREKERQEKMDRLRALDAERATLVAELSLAPCPRESSAMPKEATPPISLPSVKGKERAK